MKGIRKSAAEMEGEGRAAARSISLGDEIDFRVMLHCMRASAIAPPFVRVEIEARDGVTPGDAAASIVDQDERYREAEFAHDREIERREREHFADLDAQYE